MTETVYLGTNAVQVWPAGQELAPIGHATIQATRFTDIDAYHPRLMARILDMENRQGSRKRYFQGACGTKVHHMERWGCSEADLVSARARELFRRALKAHDAVVDLSWANVYRVGDYCMPHSHYRSTASVVYCLDVGDEEEESVNGRFCFVDPRLPCCCQKEQGYMTTPFLPTLSPGTMIIFPSQLVHAVNPYFGTRPRLTLSWNINAHRLPGEALPSIDDGYQLK